jgi:hypothetical protein
MISRHPNDSVEPIAQHPQRPFDLGDELCYIASDDQPIVVGLRSQTLNDFTIFGITHMHIADPEQPPTRCHLIGDHPADSIPVRA